MTNPTVGLMAGITVAKMIVGVTKGAVKGAVWAVREIKDYREDKQRRAEREEAEAPQQQGPTKRMHIEPDGTVVEL